MTDQNKPTSKVIQIVATLNNGGDQYTPDRTVVALCEDGSIWERLSGQKAWWCILEAHGSSSSSEVSEEEYELPI